MSTKYNLLLKQLKQEISKIEISKKKKRWKNHQKIVIDYIRGATKTAIFEKDGQKIILATGDLKKGFMHILLGHYSKNDLETMDIINIFEIYIRGIKLNLERKSNEHLTVYMKLSKEKELRLILNPINNNSFVVTAYRKN